MCLLLTAVVSYLYGSVRVGQRELRISKAARIQLAILAGVYLLLQGASLWLDRSARSSSRPSASPVPATSAPTP